MGTFSWPRTAVAICGVAAVVALIALSRSFGWHSSDMADWLSGVGSIAAAVAALFIATRDRRERDRERQGADEAQARLVLVEIGQPQGSANYLPVTVRNFGANALMDVEFDSAFSEAFPEGHPRLHRYNGRATSTPALDTDREPHRFLFRFVDDAGSPLDHGPGGGPDEDGNWVNTRVDLSKVVAWVRFQDAEGSRWRRSSDGQVQRLAS